ncbi:MAG TPA: nucleotide exchange factor GrpE [Thermoanaerobaculia bacterium]|nr:nucleotide exchange factor GrpE [Thermoanaerobaculia bacterium]
MSDEVKTPFGVEPAGGGSGDDLAEGQIEVVWVEGEDPVEEPPAAEPEPPPDAAKLSRELAEVKDLWLRTVADLDNYRKRSEREIREAKRFALFDPMRDLLAVVDNLERALSAGGTVDDLKRGVEMILQQVRDYLRGYGVKEIEAAGADFDPALHDAVARFEDPGVTHPKVADQLQRGYFLHDRLLRPALVRVAVPAAPAETTGPLRGVGPDRLH